MGRRPRTIQVKGRLVDAISGTPNADDIEELPTDVVATLVSGSRSYPNCRLIDARTFNFQGAVFDGVTSSTCEYSLEFEQLNPA